MAHNNVNDDVVVNNNHDDDTLTRQRVGDFLSNPDLKIPPSTNFYEIRTIAFLRANTGELMTSNSALYGHKKWYWVTGNAITTLYLGRNLNRTANSWKLSSRIENLTGLQELSLWKCSSIPPEIAKLKFLKRLTLRDCPDDGVELPQVEMKTLTELAIVGGNWDKTNHCYLGCRYMHESELS
jgi:hypothetical protein